MREWKPTEKADIIVSELLGSFGLFNVFCENQILIID
jgi:hypothetical protein